jgi:hypothetical protein
MFQNFINNLVKKVFSDELMKTFLLINSFMKMTECCKESPEARPTFLELKDYFVVLYNEKIRYYENDIRLKGLLPQFSLTEASCIHGLYSIPEAINEPVNVPELSHTSPVQA